MPENGFLKTEAQRLDGPVKKASPESRAFVHQLLQACARPEFRESSELLALVLDAACQLFPYDASVRDLACWFSRQFPGQEPEAVLRVANRLSDVKPEDAENVICAVLAEIENQHADKIMSLHYGEVHVWPLMRDVFARRLRGHLTGSRDGEKKLDAARNSVTRVMETLCSIHGHYKPPEVAFVEDLDTWENDKRRADFLFFSHVSTHEKQQRLRSGSASPGDYLCSILARHHTCIRLEEMHYKRTLETYPRTFPPLFFRTPWSGSLDAYQKVLSEARPRLAGEARLGLRPFMETCAKTMGVDFDHGFLDMLMADLHGVHAYAGYFKSLLAGAKAQALFLDTGPMPETMGLILACRSLDIPVVQIVSPTHDPGHADHSSWVQVPAAGFNTQADFLWTFDEVAKTRLQQALAPVGQKDRVLAGGDPRVQWARGKEPGFHGILSRYEQAFLDDLADGRFNVLLKLGNRIPEMSLLAALAKKLGDQARILVRLDQSLAYNRDSLQQVLTRNGLKNIECVFATTLPAEMLLARCHHVLTSDTVFAREAMEHEVGLSFFQLPETAPWTHYGSSGRLTVCTDLPGALKSVAAAAECFADAAAWTDRQRSFRDFRELHFPPIDRQVSGPLAKAIADTADMRRQHSQRLETSFFLTDPLQADETDYARTWLNRTPLPTRNGGTHCLVTVGEDIPLNRAMLSRLLTLCYGHIKPDWHVDFVFSGKNAQGREQEIFSVFSAMNAHPVSVHLDASGAELLRAPDCRHMPVTLTDLETLEGTDDVSLPHLIPSDDSLKQARAWLAAQRFPGQTIALTFSDWLSPDDVRRMLRSPLLQTLASQKSVIINGSHQFDHNLLTPQDPVTLFEPGIYSLEAALALSRCVDVTAIVSDDVFDMVFYLGGNNPTRIGVRDWQ